MDIETELTKGTRERALREIIESQKDQIFYLHSIIEKLPGSIYWKDKNGIYLGCNLSAMEKMKSVNLSWNSIIGQTDYELFNKETADQYRQHDLKVMNEQCELSTEEKVILPSGELLIQLSFKKPLLDKEGKSVGVVGNTIDITYLKKIEAGLREAKEKTEQISQSKTEMIRHMEHDIRTPFNGIWVLSRILESRETDFEKKQLLGDISTSAKQLLDYCNSILNIIKTDTSISPILHISFNLKDLIKTVLSIETPIAKSKNLKLKLEYKKTVTETFIGDPNRLQRILLNLISNAIKFTDKGFVKIGIDVLDKATIQLIIADSGTGIPLKEKSFINGEIKDIDYLEINRYKGHGLGLPVVKQLIGELGGKISVWSEEGKGTVFTCLLPLG